MLQCILGKQQRNSSNAAEKEDDLMDEEQKEDKHVSSSFSGVPECIAQAA